MASELDAAALDEDVKLAMEELDLGLEGADVSMSASVLDSAIEDEDLPDEPGVESTVLDASITMEDYNAVNTSIIMEDGNTLDELEPGLVLFGVAPSAIRTADEISGQDDGDLQDSSMAVGHFPEDAFVKPEEDLAPATDALLSPPAPSTDAHLGSPNTLPDDLAMQVDTRNLKSEVEPPALHHSGEEMAVDGHPASEPGAQHDLHDAVLKMDTDVAPSTLDEVPKMELEEQVPGAVDPEAFRFESTGQYDCRLILSGHTLSISALKFSPDGSMLASSAADKTVKLWDAATGHILRTFEGHTSGISDVAWSHDAEFVASASDDKTVRIWSLDLGISVKVLKGHTNYVFCLNYNPASSLLVSGGFDESVRVWDVARGKTVKVLPAHSDPVTAVSFNHDGTLIVSCAMDGLIRIWDSDSGQCLKTLVDDDNPVCSHVRFSPNSQFVLVSTQDSTIRLWNYVKSRCVKTFEGHTNKTYCLVACFGRAIGADGAGERQVVISGSEDNKVYIWDLQTRQIVQVLEGHRDAVLAVAMHPTKKIIASASKERDLSIRLWYS